MDDPLSTSLADALKYRSPRIGERLSKNDELALATMLEVEKFAVNRSTHGPVHSSLPPCAPATAEKAMHPCFVHRHIHEEHFPLEDTADELAQKDGEYR